MAINCQLNRALVPEATDSAVESRVRIQPDERKKQSITEDQLHRFNTTTAFCCGSQDHIRVDTGRRKVGRLAAIVKWLLATTVVTLHVERATIGYWRDLITKLGRPMFAHRQAQHEFRRYHAHKY
jgi:hypothetical protein